MPEEPRNLLDGDHLANPLVAPFFRFAERLLEKFRLNLHRYPDPTRAPSIGIDRNALKQLIKQQILLLNLSSCSSQEELRKCLEDDSYLKQFLGAIQDRFALDEIATSVSGTISILWESITREGLLKEELEELVISLNEGFVEYRPDRNAFPDLKNKFREIREHLITSNIHRKLHQAEKTLDKGLGIFSGWPAAKDAITEKVTDWLGLKQPIKSELEERLVPMGMSAASQAMEKIVNFWTLPYNVRYGLINYQMLPYLR
jgi:hypothetical protein